MSSRATAPKRDTRLALQPSALIDSLPFALIVLDPANRIAVVNGAAEQLLGQGRDALRSRHLADFIAADSPLFTLVDEARTGCIAVAERDISLSGPRLQIARVALDAAPIAEQPGFITIVINDRSIEHRISRQAMSRDASRSAKAMAAMLAHEVKNPLSGIRGAAQLLERRVNGDDQLLTQLICDETDRIVGLVNRMEMLGDERPAPMAAVNIHEILDHVRRLAGAGFAFHVEFLTDYDPSLPPVWGNRDQLVQVFLNLIKNAAEACPAEGGSIVLSTAFEPGLRLGGRSAGTARRMALTVKVQDNGAGVPAHLQESLFEAFVTGKAGGRGLGLALVAKLVADHDGIIECDSEPQRTTFSVSLPLIVDASADRE